MHQRIRHWVDGAVLVGLLSVGQAAWGGISVTDDTNTALADPTPFTFFNDLGSLSAAADPDVTGEDGWTVTTVVNYDSNDPGSSLTAWDKELENTFSTAPGGTYLLYERVSTNDTPADDPWLGWQMEITSPGWAWVAGTGIIEVLVGSNWEEIAGPTEGTASITGDVYDFLFDLTNAGVTQIGAGASSDLRIRAEIEWVGGVTYSTADIGVTQGLSTDGGDNGNGNGDGKVPVPATLPLLLGGLLGLAYVRRRIAARH